MNRRDYVVFGSVYFFLTVILLKAKLHVTPAWWAHLASNHHSLVAFSYSNNEQSRLLQFLIPELFHQVLSLRIENAYILQRLLFGVLALLCFHRYLRKWFGAELSFAGTTFLAAITPLTFMDDLQESSPLLLLTFILALQAIRDRKDLWLAVILLVGGLNNETMLVVPLIYFCVNCVSLTFRHMVRTGLKTVGLALPMYATVGLIRYITRDRPRLAPLWQWPDNVRGLFDTLRAVLSNPLSLPAAAYLYFVILFGAFWVFAILAYRKSPYFLQRASWMIPFFLVTHLVATMINEVRLMLPLGTILIPMGLIYMFGWREHPAPVASSAERAAPARRPAHQATRARRR